jgi:hypothetical protein
MPALLLLGLCLAAIGVFGRRRLLGVVRRTGRIRDQ